jgi:thymidylate kinase
MFVLADRYVLYMAFSRAVARDDHPAWVRAVYSFAPLRRPDLALYFRVPMEVSIEGWISSETR